MHKYNEIENMMLNIVEEGEEYIFQEIEWINEPFKRFRKRDLFYKAVKKIQENQ